MKYTLSFLIAAFSSLFAADTLVTDPIADFLSLPIKDRYTDGSDVVVLHRASVDIDSDGQSEVLVGHHKMWWGDNNGIYWAIYVKEGPQYKRATKATEDIRIQFYGGNPDFMYVGSVEGQEESGLLMAVPLQKRSEDKAELVGIEELLFITIKNGEATTKTLPGLDFSKEVDKAFYHKYFPQIGRQGGFVEERITPKQLKERGYRIPDWKRAPMTASDTVAPRRNGQFSIPNDTKTVEPSSVSPSPATVQVRSVDQSTLGSWLLYGIMVVVALGLLRLLLRDRK